PVPPPPAPPPRAHDPLADPRRGTSLSDLVHELTGAADGIKHLLGQLDTEQDIDLFRSFEHRFLLTRRNRLKAVVSCLVGAQTKQWHRRGRPPVSHGPLDPISLDQIGGFVASIEKHIESVDRVIERERLRCTRVYYEDLFSPNIPLKERVDIVLGLLCPIVGRRFKQSFVLEIRRFLDHDANKVNSTRTYEMIPNLKEINDRFGSDQNGYVQ
ncbi:MAG: hypothetical protein AAF664_26450, partial [Planctomycetota bacterium]